MVVPLVVFIIVRDYHFQILLPPVYGFSSIAQGYYLQTYTDIVVERGYHLQTRIVKARL